MTRIDSRKYAREAYEAGVRYFGGCCGFEPHHIREIAEEVQRGEKILKRENGLSLTFHFFLFMKIYNHCFTHIYFVHIHYFFSAVFKSKYLDPLEKSLYCCTGSNFQCCLGPFSISLNSIHPDEFLVKQQSKPCSFSMLEMPC